MKIRVNLTNRRFGQLLVIEPAGQAKSGKIIWLCRCDCGQEAKVKVDNLTSGHTRSCGCLVGKSKYATPEESRKAQKKVTQDWRRRNPQHLASYHRSRTFAKHHISPEQYEAMVVSQDGVCAICKRPPHTFGVRTLDIDHDHRCCPGTYSCGKCIRGLICLACNRALGLFQDNPEILRIAANYLVQKTTGAVETERGIGESRKLQSELHGDVQSEAETTSPAKIN
jgi:hypothetical protein